MFEFAAPKPGLPSLRYATFDKLFEQRVEDAQKEIREMEKLARPYGVVREALIAASLPNDTDTNLYSSLISLTIQAIPTDRIVDLESAPNKIGAALLEAGLHDDGVPSKSDGGTDPSCAYVWTCKAKNALNDDYFSVVLRILIPENGIADVSVDRIMRTFQSSAYKLFRKNDPLPPMTYKIEF